MGTVLVTGGTNGIGRAVAVELARLGDRVLIVGRDAARGEAVLGLMGRGHRFIRADLSLLRETSRVADEAPHVDAAVLCAGNLSTVQERTDEDLERTFVLNYLSRYLLVRRLLTSSQSARIVLVASAGRYPDTLDLDDLRMRRPARGLRVAGRTQFANDLLAVELAARGVRAGCVFPGYVRTDVFRNARGLPGPARVLAGGVQRLVGRSPASAARTPVFLARDPSAVAGFYGPDCRPLEIPARVTRPGRATALWEASEALVAPWLAAGWRVRVTPEPGSA